MLGLVVAEMLYEAFPEASEGELSVRLARLVRRETCAEVARGWDVGPHVVLGQGEARGGGRKKAAILADVCEALIGAVFLDGGFEAAQALVRRLLGARGCAPTPAPIQDAKTAVQEWAQARAPADAALYARSSAAAPRICRNSSCRWSLTASSPSAARRARSAPPNRRRRRPSSTRWARTMSARCGFVALIGAPNAGKSTLINALVGAKVSIVSRKAQTTRATVRGVVIEGEAQIVFVDTPGLFAPKRRLDRAMVDAAWGAAADADVAAR